MQLEGLASVMFLPLLAQAQATEAASVLPLVSHIVHVLAAVVLVGGVFYQRFVLLPIELAATEPVPTVTAARKRWAMWVGMAAFFLLASGLYSIFNVVRSYEVPKYYHPLFGIKFLLAMAVFFLSSILAGRTEAAERFRQRQSLWMTLNVLAAIGIVILAGILSGAEKQPKNAAEPAPAAVASP